MSRAAAAVCTALLGAVAARAQVPDTCDVKRNNEPYFYTALDVHQPTGRTHNQPVYQPPGYWSALPTDPGVAPLARTWRWIPSAVNDRRETRQVSGFYVWLRPSAPTTPFPANGYIPEWTVHVPRQRPDGGYEPDLAATPHVVVPAAPFVFPSFGAHRARTALSAPVAVPEHEVCWSWQWAGGEHRLLPGAQGFVGTTTEAPWKVPTWGWADASGVTPVDPFVSAGADTTIWGSYYEAQPVVNAETDYAHLRQLPPQPPLYSGCNDGAGLCDLVTHSLELGWNVDAGLGNAGALCVPLFNYGPTRPAAGTPFLGMMLEIGVADPSLGNIAGVGYYGFCNAAGAFDGVRMPIAPVSAAALGWFVGIEFVLLEPDLSGFRGTTQAHWIEIVQ